MQNKPNLQNDKINVTSLLRMDYENFRYFRCRKNKPNFIRRSMPVLRPVLRSVGKEGSSKSEEGSEGGQTQFWLCISQTVTINGLLNIIVFVAFSSAFGGQVPAAANRLAALKNRLHCNGPKVKYIFACDAENKNTKSIYLRGVEGAAMQQLPEFLEGLKIAVLCGGIGREGQADFMAEKIRLL